jgi:hypothetical protein
MERGQARGGGVSVAGSVAASAAGDDCNPGVDASTVVVKNENTTIAIVAIAVPQY